MFKFGVITVCFLMASCTVSGPDPLLGLQLPNPASVYCIERGGTIEIKESPQGDVSTCVLADGTRIDEWAFYRKNHSQ